MNYTIYREPPPDFNAQVEVASCFCECGYKLLFLRRHPNKSQGDTWGVPAGKLEKGETPRGAVIREVKEEVGLDIKDDELEEMGHLYIRLPHLDYIYYMFRKKFESEPDINLALDEHHEAKWVTIKEALHLPLIAGGKEALKYYVHYTTFPKSSQTGSLSFLDILDEVLEMTKTHNEVNVRQIFAILAGKGHASLLILFSLPFCLPITIPGFSTPFGFFLAFIGLRIAFAKRLWSPKWLLDRKIASTHVENLVYRTMKVVKVLQKVLHPRLVFLAQTPVLHRMHGLLVFALALLLSLPIPIPMTNMLSAVPILLMGLGLLEDDGIAIIVSYILASLCFLIFFALFIFGKAQISHVLWMFTRL